MQHRTKGMAEMEPGRSRYARFVDGVKRFHANEIGTAGDQPPDPAAGGEPPPAANPKPSAANPKPGEKSAGGPKSAPKPDDLESQVRGLQGVVRRIENERKEERDVLKAAGFETVADMAAALKTAPPTGGRSAARIPAEDEDREPTREDFTDSDTGEFDSAGFVLALRGYDAKRAAREREAGAQSAHDRAVDEAVGQLPPYLIPDPADRDLVRDLLDDRTIEASGGGYGSAVEARRGQEQLVAWFDRAYAARKAAEDKAAGSPAASPAGEPPPPPAGAGAVPKPPQPEGPPQSRGDMRDRIRQGIDRREAEAQARRGS